MLRIIISFLVLISQFIAAQDAQQYNYCVGFHLALDYGVASIVFVNGTTIDVAKIQGGQRYRQWMRSANATEQGDMGLSEAQRQQLALGMPQPMFRVPSLGDRIPPWLFGPPRPTPELLPMLKGLQASAESYLEQQVSKAAFALPMRVSDGFREGVFSASSIVSLDLVHAPERVAGIHAARALKIGYGECGPTHGYPEQLLLTIEFSRAAITAFVVWEACGVFDIARTLHRTTLGMQELSREPDLGKRKLTSALRDLVNLPLGDGGPGSELTYISNLVLLGESTHDVIFNAALRTVLGEQYETLALIADKEGQDTPDPVFLAPRGIAADCLSRLNYIPGGQL